MNLNDPKELASLLEAWLLAQGRPLSLERIGELFEEGERPEPAQIREALDVLRQSCEGRAFELKEVASGYRLQVREKFAPWVGRLWEERPQRYSRAMLETLALIAYRQPITRGEIEQVRGVAVSSNIIQALEEREWIRVVGHRDVPGRPALFGTTKGFLDYFGLKRLDELPPLSELKDIGELEPQLPLDGAPVPAGVALDAEDAGDADAGPADSLADGEDEEDMQTTAGTTGDESGEPPQEDATDGAQPDTEAAQDDDADTHEPIADEDEGDTGNSIDTQDDDAESLEEGRASSEQKP